MSQNAIKKREADYLSVVGEMDTIEILQLFFIGALLIAVHKMKKLSPLQGAVLAAGVILASGTLIVLSIRAQAWGLALVIMFLLGWLLSELNRM